MYAYALDEPVGLQDDYAPSHSGDPGPYRQENVDYVILTVSVAGMEITWCSGPGISTIFAARTESPEDCCVVSRRRSA